MSTDQTGQAEELPSTKTGGIVLESPSKHDSARAQALLNLLRDDETLLDAVIVVGETRFPIHVNIVAPMCPFFSKALCGDFAEAKEKILELKDASPAAVSIVIDHAYAVNVWQKLKRNIHLALTAWRLAHRFEIYNLQRLCSRSMCENRDRSNAAWCFIYAKKYGNSCDREDALSFLAVNFSWSSNTYLEFTAEDLGEVLACKDLIAKESTKFNIVEMWVNFDLESRVIHLEHLMSYVCFQRMDKNELDRSLKKAEFLQKGVTCTALSRSFSCGHVSVGIAARMGLQNTKGDWEGSKEYILTGQKVVSSDSVAGQNPFRFSLAHYAMSSYIHWNEEKFQVNLTFEHRLRTGWGRGSLRVDLSFFEFAMDVHLFNANGQSLSFSKYISSGPFSNTLGLLNEKELLALEKEFLRKAPFLCTAVVHLRCRKRPYKYDV